MNKKMNVLNKLWFFSLMWNYMAIQNYVEENVPLWKKALHDIIKENSDWSECT